MLRSIPANFSSKIVAGSRRWRCSTLLNHPVLNLRYSAAAVVCSATGRRCLSSAHGEGDGATRRPKVDLFNPSEVRYDISPILNEQSKITVFDA